MDHGCLKSRTLPRKAFLLVAFSIAAIGCGSGTEPLAPSTVTVRFPTLSNAGGHVLSPLRVVAVAATNDSSRDSLFAFVNALAKGQWWPQVATPYGISPTATAVTVTGPAIAAGTQLTFNDVLTYVQSAAIDSAGYAPDGHTVYIIFLPSGVTCVSGGSCGVYTAFHVPFGSSDAIALVTRGQAITASVTTLASHEIAESATDPEFNGWKLVSPLQPWTGSPWGLDDGGNFEENGDLCSGTSYLEGGFYYQRIFSNAAASLGGDPCVPAIPSPYFNVTTDSWYSTSTGSVTVPITGWSVGAVADWEILVSSGPRTPSLAAPTYSITCADTVAINGIKYCTANTGKTVNLRITLPPGTVSKDFVSVRILSARYDSNGILGGPGQDFTHRWIFGVYVP